MKYRKKPAVIEAFQYDGDLKGSNGKYYVPQWAVEALENGTMFYDSLNENEPPCELFIRTLEGVHHVSVNDFIIQGVQGELYPCKPDIFEQTYEVAQEMFEAMGYKRTRNDEEIWFENEYYNVVFYIKENKYELDFYDRVCDKALFVSVEIHKAIHQQMKELGWLDET